MKDIEIVIFNDNAWVRLKDFERVKEELEEGNKKLQNCANCKHRTRIDSLCKFRKEVIPSYLAHKRCDKWEPSE